jgi:hypothetical protein
MPPPRLALLIQVHSLVTRHRNIAACSIVLLEEGKGVFACEDAGALVIEEVGRAAFEDGGVDAVPFEGDAGKRTPREPPTMTMGESLLPLATVSAIILRYAMEGEQKRDGAKAGLA